LALNNIGVAHDAQGDPMMGMEYHQKSLKVRSEIDDKLGMAMSYSNIGIDYHRQGDLTKGITYFRKSLGVMIAIGDKQGESVTLQQIGGTLCLLDSLEEGMVLLKKSLGISERIHDRQWAGYTCDLICDWYIKLNILDSAGKYGYRSMRLAEVTGYPANIKRAANNLSKMHRANGDWRQTLEMYELYIKMRDSIRNDETQKAAIRQQTQYEFEKKQLVKEHEEKENARIVAEVKSRRDNLQYSVILIALLVLFGSVLSLGYMKVSTRMAEGIIFFSFLILFEFLLVLVDPYIDSWSSGAPGIKLLFNASIAAAIFPLHAFFESKLKGRLVMVKI